MIDNTDDNKWRKKLNKLNPPASAKTWDQMEVLLDKHLPLEKKNKRRYIIILLLLLLLILGIFTCTGWYEVSNNYSDKDRLKKQDLSKNNEQAKDNINTKATDFSGDEKMKLADTIKGKNEVEKAGEPGIAKPNSLSKISIVKRYTNGSGSKISKVSSETLTSARKSNKTNHPQQNPFTVEQIQTLTSTKDSNKLKNDSLKNIINQQDKEILTKTEIIVDSTVKTTTRETGKEKTQVKSKKTKGFTYGIGINYFIPLHGQKRTSINEHGTYNNWKEYLPVLQGRYYINSKMYVQAEVQLHTPQFTGSPLIDEKVSTPTSGIGITGAMKDVKSIFATKLFYFDAPLSLHFSPAKNLYLGVGLQYSHLRKATGLYEHKITSPNRPDSLISSVNKPVDPQVTKAVLRRGDIRYLFDVTARIKRFNIGVQYNSGFKSYIKQAPAASPVALPKNNSLHLFLRYQLKDLF
jgi:hypothetical protein